MKIEDFIRSAVTEAVEQQVLGKIGDTVQTVVRANPGVRDIGRLWRLAIAAATIGISAGIKSARKDVDEHSIKGILAEIAEDAPLVARRAFEAELNRAAGPATASTSRLPVGTLGPARLPKRTAWRDKNDITRIAHPKCGQRHHQKLMPARKEKDKEIPEKWVMLPSWEEVDYRHARIDGEPFDCCEEHFVVEEREEKAIIEAHRVEVIRSLPKPAEKPNKSLAELVTEFVGSAVTEDEKILFPLMAEQFRRMLPKLPRNVRLRLEECDTLHETRQVLECETLEQVAAITDILSERAARNALDRLQRYVRSTGRELLQKWRDMRTEDQCRANVWDRRIAVQKYARANGLTLREVLADTPEKIRVEDLTREDVDVIIIMRGYENELAVA
jgi:hypothetical protein